MGGKVNGEIRANGSTYRYGLSPGKVTKDRKAGNPLTLNSQIFKLRNGWESLPEEERKFYQFDYNHWPVDAGAPWVDINQDGIYSPEIDYPELTGDETLYYAANDLDTALSRHTYGSDPIGLEFQTTVFGFNRDDMKDVVFKKYKVINKSSTTIEDMYFTYWTDPDLGFAGDDYERFDSTYDMGYCFNGDNYDDNYGYGPNPPAVGYVLVQGPVVTGSLADSARFSTGWVKGMKNLGMTSSGMILKSSSSTGWPTDPYLGVYSGTLQFYNMMQGLNWDGSQIIDPTTGEPTIWLLSGDPVAGTGWYEGNGWPGGLQPGDHRFHVPTGPFTMAACDTQEVCIAIIMARGTVISIALQNSESLPHMFRISMTVNWSNYRTQNKQLPRRTSDYIRIIRIRLTVKR